MRMDPNARCSHGNLLWWNFGDGKARHISELDNTLVAKICQEATSNPEKYRDPRYIRD